MKIINIFLPPKGNNTDNSSESNNGCLGAVLILVLLVFLILVFSCTSEPPQPPTSNASSSVHIQRPSIVKQPIKVFFLLDQSGSMSNSMLETFDKKDLNPLLDHISQWGGELVFGTLKSAKSDLAKFRANPPDFVPKQRADETATEFRTRLISFQERMKEGGGVTSSVSATRKTFHAELDQTLKSGDGSSAIAQNLQIANLYMREPDERLEYAKRYIIVITDGWNVGSKDFPRLNAELLMVTDRRKANNLARYAPSYFSNCESASRHIINQAL